MPPTSLGGVRGRGTESGHLIGHLLASSFREEFCRLEGPAPEGSASPVRGGPSGFIIFTSFLLFAGSFPLSQLPGFDTWGRAEKGTRRALDLISPNLPSVPAGAVAVSVAAGGSSGAAWPCTHL